MSGRKDFTRPPLGGSPRNNLFRPRQVEERPRGSSALCDIRPPRRKAGRGEGRGVVRAQGKTRRGKEADVTQSGVFSESFPTDIWYYFSTFLMRSICQSVNTYMKSYANLEAQRYVTYFFLFFHYMSHHWGPSINARILLSSAWEALIFTRKGGIVLFI
jgi:hypothetical protein